MTTDKLAAALLKWQSLDELLTYYHNEDRCEKFLLKMLYPEGIRCPKCGGIVIYRSGHVYHCDECNTTFSVKVGTIFQSTKLPLRKWFAAIWLDLNNRKSISAASLSRELGVTYATAWHMLMKLRKTMPQSRDRLRGVVQVDAAYVGGRMKWIGHKPPGYVRGDYLRNKVQLLGLEGDRLMIKVVDNVDWNSVRPVLEEYLPVNGIVYSDSGSEFKKIGKELHRTQYVCNHDIKEFTSPAGATTNRIESVWTHIKRHQQGIYHLLTRKYAQLYIDEFVYRYNSRGHTPMQRIKDYFPNTRIVVTWKELKAI